MQDRAGADRAKAELNGVLLHDLELKIGWGKAIAIPPAPLYTAASVFAGSAVATSGKGAGGAAVPPPGVDAAPPWVAPVHGSDDMLEGIGMSPGRPIRMLRPLRQCLPLPVLLHVCILECLHRGVFPTSPCLAAKCPCLRGAVVRSRPVGQYMSTVAALGFPAQNIGSTCTPVSADAHSVALYSIS